MAIRDMGPLIRYSALWKPQSKLQQVPESTPRKISNDERSGNDDGAFANYLEQLRELSPRDVDDPPRNPADVFRGPLLPGDDRLKRSEVSSNDGLKSKPPEG